jgi:hypothetical protein
MFRIRVCSSIMNTNGSHMSPTDAPVPLPGRKIHTDAVFPLARAGCAGVGTVERGGRQAYRMPAPGTPAYGMPVSAKGDDEVTVVSCFRNPDTMVKNSTQENQPARANLLIPLTCAPGMRAAVQIAMKSHRARTASAFAENGFPKVPAVPLTPEQLAYNARTVKLIPNGQASRDKLIRARLSVRKGQ